MNKQAFTFLTLFTLVLLLSVYYVTLPVKNTSIQSNQLIEEISSDPIEQYRQDKQKQNTEIKNQNEQVISSSTSTSEEKLEALHENSVLESSTQIENGIETLLNEQGYESCFVEKNEEIIRVVLPVEHQSQMTALNVMKLIQQWFNEDVFVEVSFE